jgi:uncharacterized protein YqeY
MLRERLTADLKTAMKDADHKTVGVLRLLISAINNKVIDKKGKTGSEELTDEETMQVLMTEAKKRKESIEVFEKGGRPELAAKEKEELEVIQRYLPKQMSKEEVEKSVEKIMATLRQAQGDASFGSVMKEVMKELRGKADSALVSELVKSKLQAPNSKQ